MKEVRDLIKKAEKFLSTAEYIFSRGDYDSCVSRCYYAMFFITEAVLLTENLSASSHKGVISLFGEHFIKKDIFDREMGKFLNEAYDKRLIGDYGVGFIISEEEAKEILRKTKSFIRSLKNYLERWMKENNK